MAISEAARADLYTGLAEVLGPERAETLMSHLPRFDPAEVATKSDMAELRSELKGEMAHLRSDFRNLRSEFGDLRSEFSEFGKDISARLDRMYTTLVAGLFVIVAAMAGVVFATL